MQSLANRSVTLVSMAVVVHVSAQQWQLYTEFDGAEHAAVRINRAIEAAVAERPDRDHVLAAGRKALDAEARHGGRDPEPRWVLSQIVREIFGEEARR